MSPEHKITPVRTAVRAATEIDLPAVQALHQKLCEHEAQFTPTARTDVVYSEEGVGYLRSRMNSVESYLRLALVGEQPCGFLIGVLDSADRTWAKLESFFTDDPARGRGLGRALFDDFVRWCAEVGASRVTVAVADSNTDTWGIYLKLGFVEIERRGHSVIFELKKSAS